MSDDNPTADQGSERYNQRVALMQARTKAFRWPKGQSGNPSGHTKLYYECRKIAQQASPDMMRELVKLAKTAEDERVRSVCLIAVLDRAGIKPIEGADALAQLQAAEDARQLNFNPADYTPEQLEQIRAVLKVIMDVQEAKKAGVPQILPPVTNFSNGEAG